MKNRLRGWLALGLVLAGIAMPSTAMAGPFLGDWSWFWHPGPGCDRGQYSPLHYWNPGLYYIREYVHPSYIDQFPPGPNPPVAPSFEYERSCCQSRPAAPSSPYANPTAYYGRSLIPLTNPATRP